MALSTQNAFGHRAILVSILSFHTLILIWLSIRNGPNVNEPGHLAAGLAIWELGTFDLYPVNPPLVKAIAAAAPFLGGMRSNWQNYRVGDGHRPELRVGRDLLLVNGNAAQHFLTWARLALVPFSLLGALTCYSWSKQLYGSHAAIGAATLWCFSPTILTWGATICADIAAASLSILFVHTLWQWKKQPSVRRTVGVGVILGLALLTKFTCLVFVLWAVIYGLVEISNRRFHAAAKIAIALLIAIYVVNLGYGFDGTMMRLNEYKFVSHTLRGDETRASTNRFADAIMGKIPIFLPRDFILGCDLQKRDFEIGKPSYLLGVRKSSGWWYFYLVAFLVKEPLGFLLLILLRLTQRKTVLNEIGIILPAALILAVVSCQTGFSIHFRYILPMHPFLMIWVSSILQTRNRKFVGVFLCVWSAISCIFVLPFAHSYFSEIAGGPYRGSRVLTDSNVDWGEDIRDLVYWYDKHQAARPLFIDIPSPMPLGLVCPQALRIDAIEKDDTSRLPSGWYVISVVNLNNRPNEYAKFLDLGSVDSITYSMKVFHVE